MKEWFAQLNQREQLSLFALALAVALYLLYMLAWAPLDNKREQLAQQNGVIATSLQRVDAMVSEIMRLRDGGGASTARLGRCPPRAARRSRTYSKLQEKRFWVVLPQVADKHLSGVTDYDQDSEYKVCLVELPIKLTHNIRHYRRIHPGQSIGKKVNHRYTDQLGPLGL